MVRRSRPSKEWKLEDKQESSWGFPSGSAGKEPACQCRRHKRFGFDPWVGKIPLEEGMATHSSILAWRIPLDRGAWKATVCGVAKSQTQLGVHIHTHRSHLTYTELFHTVLSLAYSRCLIRRNEHGRRVEGE